MTKRETHIVFLNRVSKRYYCSSEIDVDTCQEVNKLSPACPRIRVECRPVYA